MGFTITKVRDSADFNVPNNFPFRVAVAHLVPDTSYASGGESFDPTTTTDWTAGTWPAGVFGTVCFVSVEVVATSTPSGYYATYDRTAKKIKIHEEEGTAAGGPLLDSSGDLSTVLIRAMVIGF